MINNEFEMGKCNLIVVGGCHVAGFGLTKGQLSFVDIIREKIQPKMLIKKSRFQLKHIQQLDYLFSHYSSDFIILQLGNNELSPSLAHILHIKKKNKNKSTIDKNTKIKTNHSYLHNFIVERAESFASPLKWFYAISQNKVYLDMVLEQIQKFSQKKFIVLSPFPMVRDNYPRRQASKYYKSLYGKFPNVTFIDLFDYIPPKQEYFNDLIHLNAKGHQLLAEPICDAIVQIMEASNLAPIKKEPDTNQAEHILHYSDEGCLTDNTLSNY
jgi:hypothetical protein